MSNQNPYPSPYDPPQPPSQAANQSSDPAQGQWTPQSQGGDAQPPLPPLLVTRDGDTSSPPYGNAYGNAYAASSGADVASPECSFSRGPFRRGQGTEETHGLVDSPDARGPPRWRILLFLRRDVRVWFGTAYLDPHQVRRRARSRPRHDPLVCCCTAQFPHGDAPRATKNWYKHASAARSW